VERIDENEEFFIRFMNGRAFQKIVTPGRQRRLIGESGHMKLMSEGPFRWLDARLIEANPVVG
jgi:hypothetical protein